MVKVAGVRFKKAGKIYYFDPDAFELDAGTKVIVETARGLEFGTVVSEPKAIENDCVVAPLKKIIRVADEKDAAKHEENEKRKQRAMYLCQEKIDKHGLVMKLIDVEYTFDNGKIIFYFTADGRVDFRELVKDLAGVFKTRIELRQIGVRDEAKMVGGIGNCGKGLCCHTWLPEFDPVSIKMAKVQNLSLNPTKISGICGRLMCCLKYENEVYAELRKGMPDQGERIKTPDGIAIVTESNILGSTVKARLVQEEKSAEKPEKLSAEVYSYKKQQISRIQKNSKKEKDLFEDIDEDLLKEIKDLLKD
ncbi:MAG: stage 0 sporulation family protein [Clostridiales bacterium]|nr:stage 0 sporulation family protein [Clostridiales bacterium]